MERLLLFSATVCLLAAISAAGQTVALTPFKIEPGTSFSASTAERQPAAARSILSPESERISSDFTNALEIIRRNHVSGNAVDLNSLAKSSITTMLGELDPHSSYFDKDEFNALIGEQNSEYSGTGSTISNFVKNGRIETYVIATQPGSAAARANLQYGDRIVAVDGHAVTGSTVDVVRDRVRGPSGTVVRLVIERASTGAPETVELTRERITQPTIRDSFMLSEGVGYIDLSEGFSHTTSAEFDLAMKELTRHGMRSLVLDMRQNGGGILDQAVKVVERFLPNGTLVISQRGRDPEENVIWRSANRAPAKLPLVVLVDAQTASAAEIVAGALQDNDRALIVGQNTFGKGLVQRVLELPWGSGLTLTTARYFTPSGRSIQRAYAGGLYDYYTHRQAITDRQETRTVTNRSVSGGAGIQPDEVTTASPFNPRRAELIDPIFFFVRDLVRGRSTCPVSSPTGCGQDTTDLAGKFREYATGPAWNLKREALDSEADYVSRQLTYQMALAVAGRAAADRVRVRSDSEIQKAIAVLPRAASLAESARKITEAVDTKKTRRVAFPGGSR